MILTFRMVNYWLTDDLCLLFLSVFLAPRGIITTELLKREFNAGFMYILTILGRYHDVKALFVEQNSILTKKLLFIKR